MKSVRKVSKNLLFLSTFSEGCHQNEGVNGEGICKIQERGDLKQEREKGEFSRWWKKRFLIITGHQA